MATEYTVMLESLRTRNDRLEETLTEIYLVTKAIVRGYDGSTVDIGTAIARHVPSARIALIHAAECLKHGADYP